MFIDDPPMGHALLNQMEVQDWLQFSKNWNITYQNQTKHLLAHKI
jgi:hypothetical protein